MSKNRNENIVITEYKVNTGKLEKPLRLALVTDFHEADPEELLKMLERCRPDIILLAGDTFERHKEGKYGRTYADIVQYQSIPPYWQFLKSLAKVIHAKTGGPCGNKKNGHAFVRGACKIAPVYMSVGNHEWYFLPEDCQLFEESGAVLLDNADCTADIRGMKLRIGGLSTCFDLRWLHRFSCKDGFKILLCHHPEYVLRYIRGRKRDTFDLVLSGHCHGGQWRIKLPGKLGERGVFSPNGGLFPKYVHGMWRTAGGRFIVSAGVSNTTAIPRFGNPCELVMVNIK